MLGALAYPLAYVENWQIGLADTAALAAVALIGYLFGHRTRNELAVNNDSQLLNEISRAAQIARELQQIAGRIREDVANHQVNINQFQHRLSAAHLAVDAQGWQTLSQEAEFLLTPTMKLATNLSLAYDELRKQSKQLMVFAGSRTDQESGLRNRKAMEEQLAVLLSMHARDSSRFALAIFCMGNAEKPVTKDQFAAMARLLSNTARDTDFVARYSRDEFVVLMPQTSLAGATIFSQRLLNLADAELEVFMCGGIVEIINGDTPEKLLSRADSALYSARSECESCLYQHTGKSLRLVDRNTDLGCAVSHITDDFQHGVSVVGA
jgi:diguanylate cyclase (GGDEF)-like protein